MVRAAAMALGHGRKEPFLNLQLTCRHCTLDEATRDYVTTRVERVEKHFDKAHGVELILSIEGGLAKAELIVGVVRGQRCVAVESHQDVKAAVDLVVDKVVRQLQKVKGKLRDHHSKVVEAEPEQ
jgi:putative sigma-54 modulation protein